MSFVIVDDQGAERASVDGGESEDDGAAMRAFPQRCEVRLSTMHRVVTALLSSAGILVLLPAVERDSVVEVLRSLLVGPVSWSRGLLAAGVVLSIALALTVLWLLIMELTRFYFHSDTGVTSWLGSSGFPCAPQWVASAAMTMLLIDTTSPIRATSRPSSSWWSALLRSAVSSCFASVLCARCVSQPSSR